MMSDITHNHSVFFSRIEEDGKVKKTQRDHYQILSHLSHHFWFFVKLASPLALNTNSFSLAAILKN